MSTSWKQNNFFGTVDIFSSIPLKRQKTRKVRKNLQNQKKRKRIEKSEQREWKVTKMIKKRRNDKQLTEPEKAKKN
jgi:hypothetical protein